MTRRSGMALLLLAGVACGSDSTGSSGGVMTVEAGANQNAPVGTALPVEPGSEPEAPPPMPDAGVPTGGVLL